MFIELTFKTMSYQLWQRTSCLEFFFHPIWNHEVASMTPWILCRQFSWLMAAWIKLEQAKLQKCWDSSQGLFFLNYKSTLWKAAKHPNHHRKTSCLLYHYPLEKACSCFFSKGLSLQTSILSQTNFRNCVRERKSIIETYCKASLLKDCRRLSEKGWMDAQGWDKVQMKRLACCWDTMHDMSLAKYMVHQNTFYNLSVCLNTLYSQHTTLHRKQIDSSEQNSVII